MRGRFGARLSRLRGVPHRHKLLFAIAGAGALVLFGLVSGFVVLLSGAMSTAATTQHFALTYRLLDEGLRFSVRTNARHIVAPDLADPGRIERGAVCYRAHCEQCHGSPANARDELAKGMLPIPNSLAQSAREWPAEWLYYVTKEGVRMTGMPAWGFRLSEESLWSTVAYLKQLPFLTRREHLALQSSADEACARAEALPQGYASLSAEELGEVAFRQYACDSCHRIEGVVGPRSHVGPPLLQWSRRKYIAGVLPNTRENLVRWILDPRSISPQTLMPDLEVSPAHAQAMADYLLRLRPE